MAGNVFVAFWDFSSAKNGSIVPDASNSSQLGDLTIVHERREDLWQGETCAVCKGSINSWSLGQKSDQAAEVWQHHL